MKPKYLQVYQDIRDKIISGYYQINSKLPDGHSLSKQYDMSVLTVNKGLDLLVTDGLIVRRRGDGSFVKDWKSNQLLQSKALTGTSQRYPGRVESLVIKFEVIKATKEIADRLSIHPKDFVYDIIRLRLIDSVPQIIEYTYMPIDVVKGLQYKNLKGSIYQYIRDTLHLNIQSSLVKITGVRANNLEKEYFNMTDSDFLMEVKQIAYLDDGRIFESSIARHLADSFEFETVIIKTP